MLWKFQFVHWLYKKINIIENIVENSSLNAGATREDATEVTNIVGNAIKTILKESDDNIQKEKKFL